MTDIIERLKLGANVTVSEFLEIAAINRWQFRALVQRGEIVPVKIGGAEVIPADVVKRFVPGLAAA